MSLLNDMLRDLSRNKQNAKINPHFTYSQTHSLLSTFPEIPLWLIMPFLCSVCFLTAFIWYDTHKTTPQQEDPATLAIEASQPLQNVVPAVLHRQQTTSLPRKQVIPVEPELTSQLPRIIIPDIAIDEDQNTQKINLNFGAAETHSDGQINKVFSALTDIEWHDEQINQALLAIQEGNDEHAELLLHQILAKFPRAAVARETLANLYLAQERIDDTNQLIDDGLKLAPHNLSFNIIKSRILFLQKQPKDALELLQQFKPNIHENPDFYGLMAAILHDLKQEREAGNLYKMLVEIEPSNGQYWLGYGLSLEYSKANKQAISAYKEVTSHYDIEPEVRAYAENRIKTLQG